MICNAKAIHLAHMNEGKYTSYSGYKDNLKKDDSFKISYQYRYDNLWHSMDFLLEKNFNSKDSIDNVIASIPIEMNSVSYCSISDSRIAINGGHEEIDFGKDHILYKGLTSGLYLNRYYKNDWEGYYWNEPSYGLGDNFYMVPFECKNQSDAVDKIIDNAFDIFGKQRYKNCADIMEERFGAIKSKMGPKSLDDEYEESIIIYRSKEK